ncbi:MAG: hypothetical protein V4760_05455 [Bdellovibrionota bacterium]
MLRNSFIRLSIFAAVLFFVVHSIAATEKLTSEEMFKMTEESVAVSQEEGYKSLDLPAIRKTIKEQEQKRKLASDKYTQDVLASRMSPQAKAFLKEYLSLAKQPDPAQALDSFIVKYESQYATLPVDLKFIVAQLAPVRAFRSMVWRLIPSVAHSKPVQAVLISQVKNVVTSLRIFAPDASWDVMKAYLTQPIQENGVFPSPAARKGQVVAQFPNEAQSKAAGRTPESYVQVEFINFVVPAVERAINRISQLNLSNEVVADLAFVAGENRFAKGSQRYLLVGEAERMLILANLQLFASGLRFNVNYLWNNSVEVGERLFGLFGVQAVSQAFIPNGIPASEIVPNIRGNTAWGLKIKTTTDSNMKMAAKWFSESTGSALAAYEALRARPVDDAFAVWNILNPANPLVQQELDKAIGVLEKLHAGQDVVFVSRISGETVRVSIFNLFNRPVEDLKSFLSATQDKQEPVNLTKTIAGKSYEFRNYNEGRSTAWDLGAYGTVFPDLKACGAGAECQRKLRSYARVLAESWTGAPFMPLLAGVLL